MTAQRDQLVPAMPLLGIWRDLPLGEAAHLIANHFERRIVNSKVAEYPLASFGEPGAELQTGCCSAGRQASRRSGAQWRGLAVVEAEILGPREFPLRHGNAAGELGEIFAKGGFEDQGLDLPELSAFVEAHRPVPHLAQRLDIGRHPGQRMGGQLFGGEALGFDVAPGLPPGATRTTSRARPAARNISAAPSARPVWASSAVRSVGTATECEARSILRQLVVVGVDGVGHRVGGGHYVRMSHRQRRDVVRDRVQVLSVAGSVRRTDEAATYCTNERKYDEAEPSGGHQSLRSGK